MYEAHYGFHELPFGLTPDTSYVYPLASFQEAAFARRMDAR